MKTLLITLLSFLLLSFTRPTQKFVLVAKAGIIVGKWNKIEYYLPTGDNESRNVFDLELKYGVYNFINLDKSDTIPFAVTKEGVYKLGFYEDHPSLTIFKEPIF